jgi:hypothetical protein
MPFKLNPFTNRLDYYETGSGPGSGITTIFGDSGSVTGSAVTIFANQAANQAGASVFFTNTGTTSTLSLSDGNDSVFLGQDSGNASVSGANNTGVGVLTLSSLTSGDSNSTLGSTSQNLLTSGLRNSSVGVLSLQNLDSGTDNTALGYTAGQAYTGEESNNITIGSGVLGTVGESNVTRIGNGSTAQFFAQGILGNTLTSPEIVTITSGGQLGSVPFNSIPTNIFTATIDFKTAGVTPILTSTGNFVVTEFIIFTSNVSGVQSNYQFNVGFTPPTYNDIIPGAASLGNTTGIYSGYFDAGTSSAPVTPSGQTLSINVFVAEVTATVSEGIVIVQGFYV